MLDHVMVWLHDPINLDILKLLGGFATTVIGGFWAFFTWLLTRRQAQSIEELKRVATDAINKARREPPPAESELPPSPPPLLLPKPSRRSFAFSFSLVVALFVTLAGGAYALVGYLGVSDTVTNQIRVCTGEYEGNCGFPHDAYLYCYADVGKWAQQRCLKSTVTVLGSHDGNKCGYANYSVLCTQRKP